MGPPMSASLREAIFQMLVDHGQRTGDLYPPEAQFVHQLMRCFDLNEYGRVGVEEPSKAERIVLAMASEVEAPWKAAPGECEGCGSTFAADCGCADE